MIAARGGVRGALAAAGFTTALILAATVLLSVVLSPAGNWRVRAGLAGFCLLAAIRPDVALLVTTALAGFGIILSHLAGVPALRVTEVLVVASLAGCGFRALWGGGPLRRAVTAELSAPLVLFAVAVLASASVWLRVHQVETGYPAEFARSLLQFVTRDYFLQPGDFWLLVSTFAILEGLALYVAMRAFCRIDGTFFDRALRMLILGGAALAVMSLVRLAEILLRNPLIVEQLRATPNGLRISPQIPDYIAAGSYFGLCWVAAVGGALASRRRWPVWIAAGMPLLAGLYLTGSRSVVGAALAGLLALMLLVARQRVAAWKGVLVLGGLATVAMIIAYPRWTGRDFAGELARQSLQVRAELLHTGVRVMATRPIFGVGIDRFHLLAGSLASPELNALFPARKNPHNDFLRFGAELGLTGLALFLWVLIRAARRTWHGLASTGDLRIAGLAGGLIAFLTTSLFSNPLMVREVSYVFWIALGLAAGRSAGGAADGVRPGVPEAARAGSLRRLGTPFVLAVGALLVCSVPFRASREVSTLNLTRLNYGFLEWAEEPDGTPYRWSGPRATFFVEARARVVEIPLGGADLPSGARQQVELLVDGRLADRIVVGADWRRFRLRLPSEPSPGPRRIDLLVTPTWVPAETAPGVTDRRRHGVRVGEIKVVPAAASG